MDEKDTRIAPKTRCALVMCPGRDPRVPMHEVESGEELHDACLAALSAPPVNDVHRLLDELAAYAADAIGAQYGTLSAGFVADYARKIAAALPNPPADDVRGAFARYVDHLGVDASEDHYGDWWDGYRQAQRDNLRRATAALNAARQDIDAGERPPTDRKGRSRLTWTNGPSGPDR